MYFRFGGCNTKLTNSYIWQHHFHWDNYMTAFSTNFNYPQRFSLLWSTPEIKPNHLKKEVHVPVHIIQQKLSEYMFSNSYYKVWYIKICKHKSEIASVRLAIDPKDGKLSSWSKSECSFEKLLTRYWHSQVKAHVLLCSPLPIHNVMQHFVTKAEKLQNEKQDETHTEKVFQIT